MINPEDIKAGMTLGHADAALIRDALSKLAELEKQEPAAFTSPFYWSELNASGRVNCWLRNNRIDPDFSVELFTRPAPAINLSELVPVYQQHFYGSWHDCDKGEYDCTEDGSRRVLYMRKIEEEK